MTFPTQARCTFNGSRFIAAIIVSKPRFIAILPTITIIKFLSLKLSSDLNPPGKALLPHLSSVALDNVSLLKGELNINADL